MWWTSKRRRPARRAAVAIEALEGRALLSASTTPVAPGTAVGPPAVLATLTPTLTWTPVAGVNGYRVSVQDQTDGPAALSATVGPTTTQYAVPAGKLLPGRQFAWTVQDVIGVTPARAGGYLHFVTPVVPAPTPVSPGTAAGPAAVLTTVRPTLTWSAVANATGYVLHVYDLNTLTTVTHTVPAATPSYTFAAGALQPGTRFSWNVRTAIGTGTGRAVSPSLRFELPALVPPTLAAPGTATPPGPFAASATPTFSWTEPAAVTGFSGYLLQLADRTTGRATPVSVPATATTYTPPAGLLVAGHLYVWNVRLQDGTLTGLAVSYPFRYFVAPPVG